MDGELPYARIIDEFEGRLRSWESELGSRVRTAYDILGYQQVEPAFLFSKDLRQDRSKVHHVLVADNPGLAEQRKKRYLVGQAGTTARNFYRDTLKLQMDQDVIVLNKVPIFTKKTADLLVVCAEVGDPFFEVQRFMANLALKLRALFHCELWVLGSSSFQRVFPSYLEVLKAAAKDPETAKKILLFKHFSHGNFKHDYNKRIALAPDEAPFQALAAIGNKLREKTFADQRSRF